VAPNCHDAFVAAISCPAIKLKFASALVETAPDWTEARMKEMFLQHAEDFTVTTPTSTSAARTDENLFSFFDFGGSVQGILTHQNVKIFCSFNTFSSSFYRKSFRGDCSKHRAL